MGSGEGGVDDGGGRSHGQGKVGANLLEKEVEGILALDEEWQRLLEHAR